MSVFGSTHARHEKRRQKRPHDRQRRERRGAADFAHRTYRCLMERCEDAARVLRMPVSAFGRLVEHGALIEAT